MEHVIRYTRELALKQSGHKGSLYAGADRDAASADLLSIGEGWNIDEALKSLPAVDRRIIEEAFFGGLAIGQIAQRLNTSPAIIKTSARRALASLWAALQPRGQR
ncbi:MAG: hypothetical protein GIX02_00960 [Candidatus Eremiobacteraeota bacterium]|nr:hypothetical protein [Candidatus Eremiobacteraeota bacterium]